MDKDNKPVLRLRASALDSSGEIEVLQQAQTVARLYCTPGLGPRIELSHEGETAVALISSLGTGSLHLKGKGTLDDISYTSVLGAGGLVVAIDGKAPPEDRTRLGLSVNHGRATLLLKDDAGTSKLFKP